MLNYVLAGCVISIIAMAILAAPLLDGPEATGFFLVADGLMLIYGTAFAITSTGDKTATDIVLGGGLLYVVYAVSVRRLKSRQETKRNLARVNPPPRQPQSIPRKRS